MQRAVPARKLNTAGPQVTSEPELQAALRPSSTVCPNRLHVAARWACAMPPLAPVQALLLHHVPCALTSPAHRPAAMQVTSVTACPVLLCAPVQAGKTLHTAARCAVCSRRRACACASHERCSRATASIARSGIGEAPPHLLCRLREHWAPFEHADGDRHLLQTCEFIAHHAGTVPLCL